MKGPFGKLKLRPGSSVTYAELCKLGLRGRVRMLLDAGLLAVERPFVYTVQHFTPEDLGALDAAVRLGLCEHGSKMYTFVDRSGSVLCKKCMEEWDESVQKVEVVCPRCKGFGKSKIRLSGSGIPGLTYRTPKTCETCEGTGRVFQYIERRS
jgi:hypothetical protein